MPTLCSTYAGDILVTPNLGGSLQNIINDIIIIGFGFYTSAHIEL